MKEFKEVTFLAILLSTCLLAQATNQIGEKFSHDTSFDDIASFDDQGSVTPTTPKGTTPTTPKETTPSTPKGTTPSTPKGTTPKGTTPTTPKGTTPTTPKGTTPTTPKGTTSTTPKGTTPTTPKGTTPKGTTPKGTTPTTPKGTTPKGSTQTPSTKSPSSSTTSKVSTSTTKKTTTAKPTPPHCLPGQKRPVEGSCKNYTECDKSFNWVQKTCTNWCHNFNPKSLKCDWSWKYQCADPTTTPCTAPTSTVTPPASPNETTASPGGSTIAPSSTTSTTSATTTKVACTNGQSKVYQSGDCKDYLQCDSGKWVKKSCSWGYDFDINKLECRWSWWAKC